MARKKNQMINGLQLCDNISGTNDNMVASGLCPVTGAAASRKPNLELIFVSRLQGRLTEIVHTRGKTKTFNQNNSGKFSSALDFILHPD